jgi:hypothetical protein
MSKWSPKIVAASAIDAMTRAYVDLVPTPSSEEFIQGLVERFMASGSPSGDELVFQLQDPALTPSDRPLPTVIAGIFITIAYSAQAVLAHETGESDQGWDHATDAQYWCGVVKGITSSISPEGRVHFESWLARTRAEKRWGSRAAAKTFVVAEWKKYRHDYDNNRSDFCRHYCRRVLNDFGVKVEFRTMHEDWLKGD